MAETPFRQLHHICIVVHDIDKSAQYYESLGVGPWQDYPPLSEYTRLDVPNPEAFGRLRYKFVNLDNVQLQLCQPPELDCAQRRFLDTRGEGVFHIGFESDVDTAARQGVALGLAVMMRGQRDNGSGFVYFDTVDEAGVVLMARKTDSTANTPYS
ncbi:MAG TPA: VOC family protein [Jatrophihabitans sp.]|nr:VOC family protein [Jatrophihabitans sp.]